jgi:hypothetical protein
MGALTITLDADQPGSSGEMRRSTGKITFSASYDDTNGDTFDPASMGLGTLTSLDLETAANGAGLFVQPNLVEVLPKQSLLMYPTSAALLHIKALAVAVPPTTDVYDESSFTPVSSGGALDLSLFVGRFVALGF